MASIGMDVQDRMNAMLHGDTMTKCPSNAKIVRIFTSSTFTDTKHERNALMTRVYPKLKELCKSKGYEFQVVDMRWGVRDESTADHMTTALCMQEIKACQELSTGPNFVTFLGQKYGYRPFPAKIVAAEFETVLEAVSESKNKEVLSRWFYRDENSVPPVYVLQPITVHLPHFNDNIDVEKRREARKEWWEQFEAMQVILRQAASTKLSEIDAAKYFISVTEDEIHNGILKVDEPNKHCFWFRRNIQNLSEEATNSKNISRFYIDFAQSGEGIDEEAVQLLENLKDNGIQKTLDAERIINYEVKWEAEKGLDPTSCPTHEKYIEALCSDFQEKLSENIVSSIKDRENVDIKDPLYTEVVQHITICQEKCEIFHGRSLELNTIREYIEDESNQSPLVVHGQSGSGKTSLVAMAARECKGDVGRAVVMRFLGTTQQSCNIRTVLYSLCQQISRIYDGDSTSIPEDYNKLTKYFADLLNKASSSKPLVLFLDSLDNLAEDYGARQLAWLPLTLPQDVKLVASTLPDEVYHCYPILKIAIPNEHSFVEVPQLPRAEATKVLELWLQDGGRSMTSSQKQYAVETFAKCSLPLFVKLTFDEVFRWKSYSSEDECVLQETVRAAIASVFEKLEYRHGQLLVSHALSYITQSKHGVSDLEMEDLLSLDEEVLNDVYQYWTPPLRRLPPLLWIRIKTELGSYIISRGADGVRVNTWYHRQFVETARKRYLSCAEHVAKISKSIGEYFLGTWSAHAKPYLDKNGNHLEADRLVAKQPLVFTTKEDDEDRVYNLRKFSELPPALIGAGMLECLKENVLCNYEWLFTKLRATSFRDVINDFHAAKEAFPDDDELVLVLETLQLSTTALSQDSAQLASQLVGRLLDQLKGRGKEAMINIKKLVFQQAHEPAHPALVPDKVCLTPPGGPIQHTITAHTSFSNVYLTRDRKRIISASYDQTLKIFDVQYGHMIRNTEGVKDISKFFVVDVTEEYGVVSGSGEIQVWKTNTGQLLHVIQSSWNISPVALINEDVVALMEKRVKVFNFRTGKQEREFDDPDLQLREHWHKARVACQPRGELVAYSRDKENTVNVLNYRNLEILHVVTVGDLNSVDAITVSTNGTVYVAEYDGGPIVSFEMTTGQNMCQIADGLCVEMTSTLETTPDGKFLVINMYQHVAVWDLVEDQEVYNIYHPSPLNTVSLGSCGRLLVTAGFDYLIRVYDLRRIVDEDEDSAQNTSRTIDSIVTPSPLLEKPNPRYTVLQSFWDYITVWDNETGKKVKEIQGNIEQTLMIDDRRALISTGRQLRILDLPSAVVTRAIRGVCSYDNGKNKRILAPALLNHEQVLAVSGGRRHLKIMSLVTGELVKTLKADSVGGHIERLLVSKDGITAVAINDCGSAVVWNMSTHTYKVIEGVSRKGGMIGGQCSGISDDGQHLVNIDDTGGAREVVRVYNLTDARLMFSLPTTESRISCVAIATAKRRVLTGSRKHCLSIWDLDTGHALSHFSEYDYQIHAFTLSADGSRVLTSSLVTGEQSMRVYDIVNGKLLAAFTPEESWTSAFHVADSNVVLCKPGFTGVVKFRLRIPSLGAREKEITETGEEIDWAETRATMNDVTTYEDDGDDDFAE